MNRYDRTDLVRSARASWIVIAVLVLSFFGPLVSSLLRSSVEGFLNENSRRVLTADIAVTAYRPIRDDEIERLRAKYGLKAQIREVEFVTMTVGSENRSAMVEVHAVEPGFPIDGEFEFSDGSKLRGSPVGENVWLSDDAVVALDLKVGERIQLGNLSFLIERVVKIAPGVSRAGFGFAPRAYIPIGLASSTGLLGFGSQVYHRVYLETEKAVGSTDEVRDTLGDPDLFLRTPDDSIQGIERFAGFVSLYLAVVSVSLFTLGWAAAFYIVRTQATTRMRSAAIALVFGATARETLRFEFLRICILTLIAAGFALALALMAAFAVEPFIARALAENVAGVFHIIVSWKDVLALLLTALASALIFTIPFAARLQSSKLVELFQDSPLAAAEGAETRFSTMVTAALSVATLLALSTWLTRDAVRGLQLTAGLTLAVAIIHVTGIIAFRWLAAVFKRAHGSSGSLLRLAGTQLSRARFAVRLSFLAIGLSTFVASSVGQIMVSLGDELLQGVSMEKTPDFFLFNIPESQLEDLQASLAKEGTRLDFLSPMILARIQSLNGRPPKNEQFLKFPVRITWREKQIASEVITEGPVLPEKFAPSPSHEIPLLSLEARFAERNGFKIGDRLMFDVQGVPVEGEVGNIRRVRWTDFNPNFFISFQGGVLEDAPKTWLGNVRVPVRENRAKVQAEIVRSFPDLSVIDVSQTITRLVGVMKSILTPAEQAAWWATIFSILVLVTIVAHSTHLRAGEMNLFRILGAEPRRVRWLYRIEFALAAGLGSAVGALGGVVLAAFVSRRFLDLAFRFDLSRLVITILVGLLLGAFLGDWLFSRVSRGLGFARRVV